VEILVRILKQSSGDFGSYVKDNLEEIWFASWKQSSGDFGSHVEDSLRRFWFAC
jgi:hypothetical protein